MKSLKGIQIKTSKVNTKGQIVIPVELRIKYGIVIGTERKLLKILMEEKDNLDEKSF
ncbi:MAG: hypothetical protein OQJ81_00495 [Melioribacteraceae bacterium]|nr:hypothetical protein [Melioribacteraceae bacterium]